MITQFVPILLKMLERHGMSLLFLLEMIDLNYKHPVRISIKEKYFYCY